MNQITITIACERDGTNHTVTITDTDTDMTATTMLDTFAKAMVCYGYHPTAVRDACETYIDENTMMALGPNA